MKIICVGGGPGGLYFATLLKQRRPEIQIEVFERNGADETFGFGVVFSDASLNKIAEDDPETYRAITARFAHWDDIDVYVRGELRRSSGHGFCGLSRKRLLQVLLQRCEETGVRVVHHHEIENPDELDADLVIGADGLNSALRDYYKDDFQPRIEWGTTRFIWLGTTRRFPAFTFYFKENEHGMWRVHAYNYEDGFSTFIVETTEEAWKAAGLEHASEETSRQYCETLFADELEGHPLLINRSIWRRFPIVTTKRWSRPGVVLIGDAVHTAHFSIGSGTKLAIEDASALVSAICAHGDDLESALVSYERDRRPVVEGLQRAALVSQRWFEEAERYVDHLNVDDFNFSLLTRSLRVTHSDLKLRDPQYVGEVNTRFAERAFTQLGLSVPEKHCGQPLASLPPMFTPIQFRGMRLDNRIALSPMCMYSATDGLPNDWTLTHLGSRAVGGNGLIITEMTAVCEDGRITPGCTGIYRDDHEEAWRRIVHFVHEHSNSKIALQVGHAGRKGATRLMWEGMDQPLSSEQEWPLRSASALAYFSQSQTPSEITEDEIYSLIKSYRDAARRADRAGFDMLELHCAHGYLLASFISPLTNRRTDRFGGSIEARAQVPLMVLHALREAWPEDKPISVRISATDWEEEGINSDEFVALAQMLKEAGCDLLNTSTGQTTPHGKPQLGRLFQTPFAERARLEGGIPTMVAGGISSFADVNSVLAAGRADLCLIGRAQLFDPYWVRHAAFEQGVELSWPKPYGVVGAPYTPRMEWSSGGQLLKQT